MRKSRFIAALCAVLMLLCMGQTAAQAAVFYSDVRVLLSLGRQKSLDFTPVGNFVLKEDPSLALGNDQLTVTVVGARVSLQVGGKTITGPSLTLKSGTYGGTADYIRLRNSTHGTCTYLGDITFDVSGGNLRAVNTLPIEQYLYGVVPHEMSNLFPVDALKAQAVCARGYAISKCYSNRNNAYDILDTSQDQVYRGYASANTRAIAAVNATRGQVLSYNENVIEAFYAASNGGQTEKTGNVWRDDLPYYAMVDDPFDLLNKSSLEEKSFIPEEYTEKTIRLMDADVLFKLRQAASKAVGGETTLLATLDAVPKEPSYDEPSRSYTKADVTLLVQYSEDGQEKTGQVTVTLEFDGLRFGSGENVLGSIGASRRTLRMQGVERGTYVRGAEDYSGWYLTSRRYGHGIGLSQRGAQERARAAQPYTEILSFYYVGTTLITVGTYESAPKISSSTYRVSKAGISGIPIGTSAEQFLAKLSSEGSLRVLTARGAKASDSVATGYVVRVSYNENTTFFDLPLIVYGDLTGDGSIKQEDIDALQNHLLRATPLSGVRLSAADVNHDGEVDVRDLLLLIRHVNADAEIALK